MASALRWTFTGAGVCAVAALATWLALQRFSAPGEEQGAASVKPPARRQIDPETHEVFLHIDRDTQQRIGLATARPDPVRHAVRVILAGFSVAAPHRTAELRAPWTGRIDAPANTPQVGDTVRKGQVLAQLRVELTPAERIPLLDRVLELKGNLAAADAEIAVNRAAADRLRQVSDGAVAAKQRLEVEGQLAVLQARRTALAERHRSLEELTATGAGTLSLALVAPQDGRLTETRIRPGEIVEAGARLARIDDPRELHVRVLVPPGTLSIDELPAEAAVLFSGLPNQAIAAKLVRIERAVDPRRQAIEVLYVGDNPGGRIPMGLQARVAMSVGRPSAMLRVPRSAVLQGKTGHIVYLQRADDQFVQRPVRLQDSDEQFAYLAADLPASAAVVSSGAAVLLGEEHKESIQLIED